MMKIKSGANKLYYFDTYKISHTSTATLVDHTDNIVELNETIFHPQGGGQPSDIGTINGIEVAKVKENKEDGTIQHILAEKPNFSEGDMVSLKIDKDARILFSRLHTGGHLLANLVEKKYPGLTAKQGHHFPNEARVEFEGIDIPDISKEDLLSELKQVINAGLPIISMYDDKVGRTITIDKFSTTPCGGTHLKNTLEIGEIEIRSINIKKGRLRIGYDTI